MDKIEACVLSANATQTQLVAFLKCFEGENGNRKSLDSAQQCSTKSHVNFDAVKSCYSDPSSKEAAWQAMQTKALAAGLAKAKCFPWVTVGGALFSNATDEACVPARDFAALQRAICLSYKGTKPAGCSEVS